MVFTCLMAPPAVLLGCVGDWRNLAAPTASNTVLPRHPACRLRRRRDAGAYPDPRPNPGGGRTQPAVGHRYPSAQPDAGCAVRGALEGMARYFLRSARAPSRSCVMACCAAPTHAPSPKVGDCETLTDWFLVDLMRIALLQPRPVYLALKLAIDSFAVPSSAEHRQHVRVHRRQRPVADLGRPQGLPARRDSPGL